MSERNVIVVGSTGSVGTQALDVLAENATDFAVVGLAAGSQVDLLLTQALDFSVPVIGLTSPPAGGEDGVRKRLSELAADRGIDDPVREILLGETAAEAVASRSADIVLNAVTGAAGLGATLAALEAGTDVALANKESLIIGGSLVLDAAERTGARLIPVDSEHSAIAQALRSGTHGEVARLVITASGGPFRGMTREALRRVTPAQALKHPTWSMGSMITINSATLVNKGLEVIEAHLLFGIDFDDIEVVVHPQSQIHSMVEFTDASTIAQISPPDMRLPIAYALGTQDDGTTRRIPSGAVPNNWGQPMHWSFEPVNHVAFPALSLAIEAGKRARSYPAVFNAANEVLVEAFIAGDIPFTGIDSGLERALAAHEPAPEHSVETVLAADAWARGFARDHVAAQTGDAQPDAQPAVVAAGRSSEVRR
ncbi:1-deoxy-D-xylulose-5-phosphate reductoisomerase [Brevibacterium casei]|uniref:1-deoxy-D-xylulose 5-phosphate reductoisomerase n=1 Tax=Brevibacterium casei TaxID=33889 RepID=A0A165EE07_9MICO|nr:1-deoxy-D-xylulose-5-phosphate reductoisomerase [Brevibacterium casei]KZE22810.1 1-deoxy-D-xylulose 5-phosphate reductoisomerase [Brevibacterium casei]MCT1445787.1 1-deoxy-D-xylulose-5-phosphate reductoisomerase [Brevibacterium casei]MCT2181700.1 1-deoxy-D-xylulose-5-phosphate reductoisomerase [Brevibacterium casei]MCT2357389.1 1-deoxy-D-xylulose-5-phosphate reductoisomerase [Brevibacterium casei]MDH5149243.1 1-deoxy-D-xylulose-5-phosphate reductoisomerase [Brevibacterium casei]